jgi:hypothetical protein
VAAGVKAWGMPRVVQGVETDRHQPRAVPKLRARAPALAVAAGVTRSARVPSTLLPEGYMTSLRGIDLL